MEPRSTASATDSCSTGPASFHRGDPGQFGAPPEVARSWLSPASDHGRHFGEHGFMGHGLTLYQPSIHVPLLIWAPGRIAGVRASRRVSLRDLAGAILDVTGVQASWSVQGTSLARFWEQPAVPTRDRIRAEVRQAIRTPARYPASNGDLQAFIAEGCKYIHGSSGDEELYSPAADPLEPGHLIDVPALRDLVQRFRAATSLKPADSRGVTGQEPQTLQVPSALNMYLRYTSALCAEK